MTIPQSKIMRFLVLRHYHHNYSLRTKATDRKIIMVLLISRNQILEEDVSTPLITEYK